MTGSSAPGEWTGSLIDAGWVVLAFGLAGVGAFVASRLVAALVLAHFDRTRLVAEELLALAARGVVALERLVETGQRGAEPATSSNASNRKRDWSLAAIERAMGATQWAEAEALLDAFEAEFLGDPELDRLKNQLVSSRRNAAQEHLARLEAARQVKDPDRVLEIFQVVGPGLEAEARTSLERDLAKWCLDLIHRRLRTGKIQPEVVLLATRVAETFGTTIEGASLRAALPTLRRSVGLCPRCAQPYTGNAVACPKCLSGASNA
jgi:hypothetical protein